MKNAFIVIKGFERWGWALAAITVWHSRGCRLARQWQNCQRQKQ
jgi:hypothetical protein